MRHLTLSLLTAACALASVPAHADSVLFTGFADGSKSVTFNLLAPNALANGSIDAGGFTTVLNGGPSFVSYCVDLYQTINFGTTYTDYSGPVTNHTFANANAAMDLGRLFTNVGSVLGATQQAAFQIAVWEIAYETGIGYSLGAGAARFSGGSASSSGALTMAQGWLDTLGNGPGVGIQTLESRSRQDVISAIPEPETYALMLMGLAGLSVVAKRRRAAAAARS